MTNKLKEAFEMPDGEQGTLAAAILEEIESDARWTASIASNPAALQRLANEAVAEHRAGRTTPFVPDEI